ncbi:hypothetical protein XELAEV_18000208mg [Xenopus laevis]|uniref:Reverse transcriptase domain-containing protein n=1 Tax=Xenopus laevis TaxID=8355 RepID=A0A974BQP9_XENLA|nr:hypothetical protein XELAEV_18000208mg [Xenopus laevis]
MGSRVAPAFMSWFEEEHIFRNVLFTGHCVVWWRYIDDMFLLWRGDLESLAAFRNAINGAYNNIEFTMTADLQSRSIPTSQFTRVKRITNNQIALEQESMGNKLHERGYPNILIQTKKQLARDGMLSHQKKAHNDKRNRLAFVSQYNTASSKCKYILDKHWNLVKEAYPSIPEFEQGPMMSYWRGATIGSRVEMQIYVCSPGRRADPSLLLGRVITATGYVFSILQEGELNNGVLSAAARCKMLEKEKEDFPKR